MSDATQKARALLAAATPGPWVWDVWFGVNGDETDGVAAVGPHHPDHHSPDKMPHEPGHGDHAYDCARKDADLIAAAPDLLAALCDELDESERLRESNSRTMEDTLRNHEICAKSALKAAHDQEISLRRRHAALVLSGAHQADTLIAERDAALAEVTRLRNRRVPCPSCRGGGYSLVVDRLRCHKCMGTGDVPCEP